MEKKGKLGCGSILVIALCIMGLLGSCGEDRPSTYEKNLDSGWGKWSTGDYGSMTDDEKDAVEDFLNWADEH